VPLKKIKINYNAARTITLCHVTYPTWLCDWYENIHLPTTKEAWLQYQFVLPNDFILLLYVICEQSLPRFWSLLYRCCVR